MKSIILFGHGARSADWARPMEMLAATVKERAPDTAVRLAFLEFMSPTLSEAIDEAVAAGAGEVRVVPVFLAQGGHVKRDMPEIIAAARVRHATVDIRLMPALGESLLVLAAMAEVIVSA
ncbi:MAG: CbiX/SirB N-terminal domain-containing protein [Uliginosibacterium sp.]|jgi:sirohydrochlorin cobaltochelatase|nr:CbiX/SirB N-terminal domain-containing protein [Uliginosibacterium sp.]